MSTSCSVASSSSRSTITPSDGSRRHTGVTSCRSCGMRGDQGASARGSRWPFVSCLFSGLVQMGSRVAVALVVCVTFVYRMLRVTAWIIVETFGAQDTTLAEDWFERHKFWIRPETSGSSVPPTPARGFFASASNSHLRKFLGSDQRGNLISEI